MAGRMGGRGRGRPNQSFSMERELGIPKGDTVVSTPTLQPSPNYPPLDSKPPPINLSAEMSYLVELKRDFTEYVRESPNNVQAVVVNEDIERFCEDYEETIAYTRTEYESRYDWDKMPGELKSSSNKRKSSQKNMEQRKKIKVNTVDIEKKLAELEKTENTQQIKMEKQDKEQEEEEDTEDKDVDERIKNEDVEMDDGTDYANEYFENGDNYYSEDENDDGPTF